MNLLKIATMLYDGNLGMDIAIFLILMTAATLYIVSFVFRFQKKKKRSMSNFLELSALILFLVYTIMAHNIHFDFGKIPVFLANLALTIFALILVVRKIMLYNK